MLWIFFSSRSLVRLPDRIVRTAAVPTAMTEELGLVRFPRFVAVPGRRPSPRQFHFGSDLEPCLVHFVAQAIFTVRHWCDGIVRFTDPWFLTRCKVDRVHVRQSLGTAILAFRLVGVANVRRDVGFAIRSFDARLDCHGIVPTPIEFHRMTWTDRLKVIRQQTLKGGDAVKEIRVRMPTVRATEVALFHNACNLFVDGTVGFEDTEPALGRFDFDFRSHHGVVRCVQEPQILGNVALRPHEVVVVRRTPT